ncbi:MAG: glycosyltransferase [Candidatus Dormibacteraeota bacterium]|uniref:Glycosyltransferase n=1 Tax=Candidatus Amunia macphersoniae TaxID=3127014 RepID=A0A934KII9_9BACT|nr:glycosyltransferase [Candidatus Dormibacteraeota bacterium]
MRPTYLLPLRREIAEQADGELARYVRDLAGSCDVLVVDGSTPAVAQANAAAFGSTVTLITPAEDLRCANGKTWGVHTGLRHGGEVVVIADDDVRWDPAALARALAMLDSCDLVLPQNYFSPLVWHAAWDTGRTLLNRAVAHDWPGTLVLRSSALPETPPYRGDALFENCELLRTVRADGGRVRVAGDLFVARRPPSVRQFLSQRPRQAYDDLSQPARMTLMLLVLPVALRVRGRGLALAIAVCVAVAETGRRRHRGGHVFPWYTSLCAPLWMCERSLTAWWAMWLRISGRGAMYGGRRLLLAATPGRVLRRRAATRGRRPA